MPDLTGKTTEEASRLLEESGLELDPVVKEEESDTVDDGAVVSQNPSAGSQVSKGTKVVITVSTGKAQVRVPTITGMKWEQAQDNITSILGWLMLTLTSRKAPSWVSTVKAPAWTKAPLSPSACPTVR